MKPSIIIKALLFIITVESCNHDSTVITYPTTKLDRSIMDTANVLISETSSFRVPITTGNLYVWRDSIAVVIHKKGSRRKFLELYNINSGRLINSYFHEGNGPDEILECISTYNNDTVLLEDIQKHNLAIIPLDSMLNIKYKPTLVRTDVKSQRIWPYKGKLLGVNPNCFTDKRQRIQNGGNRFIISDSNFVYSEKERYKYDTYNLTSAGIIIGYSQNRIIYYSQVYPVIEIYDTGLNLLKKIEGPDLPHDPEYFLYGDFYYVFKNEVPHAYTYHCCDSSFFYLAYIGEYSSYQGKKVEDLNSWIFKFDWDGNFIESYHIDTYIETLSVSDDGKVLYILCTDENGESILNKYPMT